MLENRTIAAIATPPGQGGIAVVRLSGPESYPIAERVFRPRTAVNGWRTPKATPPCTGQFADGDDLFDDGIALFFSARPTAIPARTWWNCPATAGTRWPAAWWKPALGRGPSRPARGSTPGAPSSRQTQPDPGPRR